MTTERERYLLTRCLRLEAEIASLKGVHVAPPLEAIECRSLYDGPFRRHPRPLTTAEIARIRDLWRIGRTRQQIADMTGFAVSTVRTHTRRIAIDREVGG